jgi:hypothetical protein
MRPILEALARSILTTSGLELAVMVSLLGIYMWLEARTPAPLIARARNLRRPK